MRSTQEFGQILRSKKRPRRTLRSGRGSRTNSRDQAIFQQVLRLDLAENFASLAVLRRQDLGAKANRGRSPARGDDLLEPIEGTSAHEQDVSRVDLQEFLLRMLASALRRHRRDGALHDLEQGLLNALARDVAGRRCAWSGGRDACSDYGPR